jgi:hypothetical protein
VPTGVTQIEIVVSGGGGGGGDFGPEVEQGGGVGGGQGASETVLATVSPGDTLTITIGSGGLVGYSNDENQLFSGTNGGSTSVVDGATTLADANGGGGGATASNGDGGGGGGAPVFEPDEVVLSASTGLNGGDVVTDGCFGPESYTGGAGGGVAGVAGSGGDGGSDLECSGDTVTDPLPGTTGFAEILPA